MNIRRSCSNRLGVNVGLVSSLLLCSLPGALAAPRALTAQVTGSPLRVSNVQANERVTRLVLDGDAYEELKSATRVVLNNFALDRNRRVDLELRQFDIFTEDARVVLGTAQGDVPLPRPDVVFLSGSVVDQAGSTVFLSLSPHGNNGIIRLPGETFVLSSERNSRDAATVIYNLTALPAGAINWSDWRCDVDKLHGPLPREVGVIDKSSGSAAAAAGISRLAQLAIETDWEFTGSLFGGDTGASGVYAATLVSAVSEIYARDFSTLLRIEYLRLWSTSADPWNQGSTSAQLGQFRNHWNTLQTDVDRHAAHFLSGRGLGGGIAYLPGLCEARYDYGLSANLSGSFPLPVQDNRSQNWDLMVVAHELGHNFNAPHTHSMAPRIDNCAGGDCSVTPHATIMSYCHQCSGGMSNMEMRFHERIINERVLPFLTYDVECDLSAEIPTCPVASRPLAGELGAVNRYLSFVGRNTGKQTALRVKFVLLPPPYDALNGTTMWVGEPREISENSGEIDQEAAPGYPTFWVAGLVCQADAHEMDWSTLDTLYVYSQGIVPGATYVVEEIEEGCDLAHESNYSFPLQVVTSPWGDVCGPSQTGACAARADGVVDVQNDVLGVLTKFGNGAGAIPKASTDLEPATPDWLVNVTNDLVYCLEAFQGGSYPFNNVPGGCP